MSLNEIQTSRDTVCVLSVGDEKTRVRIYTLLGLNPDRLPADRGESPQAFAAISCLCCRRHRTCEIEPYQFDLLPAH